MNKVLKNSWALFLGMGFLMMAYGFQGSLLGVRALTPKSDPWNPYAIIKNPIPKKSAQEFFNTLFILIDVYFWFVAKSS